MAKVFQYRDDEEFYAQFWRVEGPRGTVLVFPDENAPQLACDIGKIVGGSNGSVGALVYVLWSHAGDGGYDSLSMCGLVATEDEAEAWRLAVDHGVRWWEMWEVGQPEQGRLNSSPQASA